MPAISSTTISALVYPFMKAAPFPFLPRFKFSFLFRPFSASTPYPLYYELIHYRPERCHPRQLPDSSSSSFGDSKFSSPSGESPDDSEPMDRAKRRYYRKRQKRMYGNSGLDSESGRRSAADDFVVLNPEIVDFPSLHAREQELYFYDAFALPWEKDKHYRMVYQLEKKFFPEQSFDNAFVDPAAEAVQQRKKGKALPEISGGVKGDERALMFFDVEKETAAEENKSGGRNVPEKRVGEFFKSLKKAPNAQNRNDVAEEDVGEPFLSSRALGLPAKWDGPSGTVALVDKPKGWTSFTVCGKLRRLVKVQKVGHAGTLDPMATGLLIVCVGKATKIVDRYQGMTKGYSGVFRLGEATSTWDADSPVNQREPWEHIKDADIRKIVTSFHGDIWQVPPMFSAIKIGGEKMYDKARRGEMLQLSPRRITIYEFDIERSLDDRQNLIFRVSCSKGTYIRSLCADFGKALGSCAHLVALRRDSIGEFTADEAWNFQDLEDQISKAYL